jgi:dipeptide/tripeptide permease
MGINTGAFIAPFICGYLGQRVGWHYGFGAAGVGMLLGLLIFLWGRDRYLPGIGTVAERKATQAATVGPVETWKSERVSIWHPGHHDNRFGLRLTALMISMRVPDAAVPMSLMADHPNVHFHYFRPAIGKVEVEMH